MTKQNDRFYVRRDTEKYKWPQEFYMPPNSTNYKWPKEFFLHFNDGGEKADE